MPSGTAGKRYGWSPRRMGYLVPWRHRRHCRHYRLITAVRRFTDRYPGFRTLGNIGVEAFTGFFAALANIRVVAPVVTGQALARRSRRCDRRTAPCASAKRSTRQSRHQVDLVLRPPRIMAGTVVIIPLYATAIPLSSGVGTVGDDHLLCPVGRCTYEHYFHTFRAWTTSCGRSSKIIMSVVDVEPSLLRLLRQWRCCRCG